MIGQGWQSMDRISINAGSAPFPIKDPRFGASYRLLFHSRRHTIRGCNGGMWGSLIVILLFVPLSGSEETQFQPTCFVTDVGSRSSGTRCEVVVFHRGV